MSIIRRVLDCFRPSRYKARHSLQARGVGYSTYDQRWLNAGEITRKILRRQR